MDGSIEQVGEQFAKTKDHLAINSRYYLSDSPKLFRFGRRKIKAKPFCSYWSKRIAGKDMLSREGSILFGESHYQLIHNLMNAIMSR